MAQPSQSNLAQSPFCIHVLRTTLHTALKPRRKLHIAVILPSTEPFRSHSLQSECNLEWDRRYEFTTRPSHEIKLELVVERSPRRSVHGQAQITVENLLQRCQGDQDCTLELLKPRSRKEVRGHITVRLERRLSATLSHEVVREELSHLDQDMHDCFSSRETNDENPVETIARLLDRMDPFMRIASTVLPALDNARGSVSSLYKVYQKRKAIDGEIKDLLRIMCYCLKFVEDTSNLKKVLFQSQSTVEKLLVVIHESSQFIRVYLDTTGIGGMWRTEGNVKKVEDYKGGLESLRSDLYGEAIGSLASRSNNTRNKELRVVIPPPPSYIFTGREDYLAQMEESFDLTKTSMELNIQRIFILYGIGGMGKTQLALKFRERNTDKFTKQYMIDASSEESIDLSFASIGDDLGIPDADRSKVLTRLIQLKEDWLLIYDNADNPKMRLTSFFPKVLHGNIIVTTRNAELGRLAQNETIEVLKLDEEAAIHLLLQSSRLPENEENKNMSHCLVEKFGRLALAIVQAGSYIACEQLDLHKYLALLEKTPGTLLRGRLGQDVDYKSPVFQTWEISYAGLSGHAQTLLNICSFLYRDGITEDVIRLAVTSSSALEAVREHQCDDSNEPSDSPNNTNLTPSRSFLDLIQFLCKDGGWDEYHFRELMRDLCSYSLVQRPFPGVYSIHPLVHEWARDRLEESYRDGVQQDVWLMLYYSTQSTVDKKISVSRMLLSHIGSCGRATDITFTEAFAGVYTACGRWAEAGKLEVEVLEARKQLLGHDHPDTLTSMGNLASTYRNQGRWAEAEKLQVEVLEATKQLLGPDHPDTLIDMGNLASTYWDQGRWAEAEKLLVEVLEAMKQVLGPDHPDTLTSMGNLASTYRNQGRWAEAEKLQVEVLEARKQLLGPDHPHTLANMGSLALTYGNQGRWAEAERLLVEVLEATKQLLGPDHPDTLLSMGNLASTYGNQGRWAEAERLEVEVLEARRQLLGPDHPDTLNSMANLADTLRSQGRLNEASTLLCPAVESSKRVLGPEHPHTIQRSRNLISVYRELGRLDEAGPASS